MQDEKQDDAVVTTLDLAPYLALREELLGAVREILIENLHVDRSPEEVDPDVPLFGTGLGLDSVDAVELLVGIEVAFAVKLPSEIAGRLVLRTPNTIIDFVLATRRTRHASPA